MDDGKWVPNCVSGEVIRCIVVWSERGGGREKSAADSFGDSLKQKTKKLGAGEDSWGAKIFLLGICCLV